MLRLTNEQGNIDCVSYLESLISDAISNSDCDFAHSAMWFVCISQYISIQEFHLLDALLDMKIESL